MLLWPQRAVLPAGESLEHGECRGRRKGWNRVDALVGRAAAWERIRPLRATVTALVAPGGTAPSPRVPACGCGGWVAGRSRCRVPATTPALGERWPPKTSHWFGLLVGKRRGLLSFDPLQPRSTPLLCFVPRCNSAALIFCITRG